VVVLVNTNPDLSRICDFCWAVLNFLGDQYILVGSKAYIDFQPQYHNHCYCKYISGKVPATANILTDGFDRFYDILPDKKKKLPSPDKQPTKYLKEIRAARDKTIIEGLAIGGFVGLVVALKEDQVSEATELIRKLIKRGWDDAKIIDRVKEKYPRGEGMKALKEFGYGLEG